jgi:hypothetical protein
MYLPSYEALPGIMILHSLSSSLWTLLDCKMWLMRAWCQSNACLALIYSLAPP